MAILCNPSPLIYGYVEPPFIPGFSVRPQVDEWLRATGFQKEWFVCFNGTHWTFKQLCRGGATKTKGYYRGEAKHGIDIGIIKPHAVDIYLDDRTTKAATNCPRCFCAGYTMSETRVIDLCQCPSGIKLMSEGHFNGADGMFAHGLISVEQYTVITGRTPRGACVTLRREYQSGYPMATIRDMMRERGWTVNESGVIVRTNETKQPHTINAEKGAECLRQIPSLSFSTPLIS